MTTVSDILSFLDTLAPRGLAESWDNVGLLCGSGKQEVSRILVALDPFENVCREAVEVEAQLIVTHHPLIFDPLKSVTEDDPVGRCLRLLCRSDISAINAHTNLDYAPGGVNDTLAAVLGLTAVQTILLPGKDYGLLRHGTVERQPLGDFLALVKRALGCPGLRYADAGKPVRHVAVGGGACGSELKDAVRAGCDTFVTSDVKYNQFRDAFDLGLNLIDAGHFATENPVTAVLARKLKARFPEVEVISSRVHRDVTQFFE